MIDGVIVLHVLQLENGWDNDSIAIVFQIAIYDRVRFVAYGPLLVDRQVPEEVSLAGKVLHDDMALHVQLLLLLDILPRKDGLLGKDILYVEQYF